MGLFNRGLDGPKFRMREKMFSIGEDYWIEADDGHKAYKVDGKAISFRQTFILEDASGNELCKIQEKKLTLRDKMTIEGPTNATVKKALIGIGDRYVVECDKGADFKAHGDLVGHEYEIERDGKRVAEISKKWFRFRDTYGIHVAKDQDVPLVLSIAVCVDEMVRDL